MEKEQHIEKILSKEIAKPSKKQAATQNRRQEKDTKDIKKQRIKRNKMDIKVFKSRRQQISKSKNFK